jgi:hypothetical protein
MLTNDKNTGLYGDLTLWSWKKAEGLQGFFQQWDSCWQKYVRQQNEGDVQ